MVFIAPGFVVGLTIERNYLGRSGEFVVNRLLRIYPAFWTVLGLTVPTIVSHGGITLKGADIATVSLSTSGPTEVLRALPIVTGYPGSIWRPIAVTWSLQVELSFYIVVRRAMPVMGPMQRSGLAVHAVSASTTDRRFEDPISTFPIWCSALRSAAAVFVAIHQAIWPPIAAALLPSLFGFSHISVTGGPHLRLVTPFPTFASRLTLSDGDDVEALMVLMRAISE